MTRRSRLEQLTRRWSTRRDAQRLAAVQRPDADSSRAALAAHAFPFRSMAPAAYVDLYGSDMIGFTYDDARYADPQLDAWLLEVGRLLRMRR